MVSPTPVWADFVSGSLTSTMAAIAAGATQPMVSSGLTSLPTVVDGVSFAKLTLDPFGVLGLPELVHVTSHAAGTNTATIQRIAGQPLRQHNASEQWLLAPTAEDFNDFQTQLDNQFHTTVFTAAGEVLASSAAGVPAAQAIGTEFQALTVATAQATKLQYRPIPFVCTSGTRPQQSNGVYLGMPIFESDTLHTLQCTTLGNPCTWTYVDTAPGSLKFTANPSLDNGWVWCDGSTYDGTVAKYTPLWNILGNRYGGSAQNNFKVPDLRQQFLQGWDPTNVQSIANAGALGFEGGAATATLLAANLPVHTHSVASHLHAMVHDHPAFSTTDNHGDHFHGLGGQNPEILHPQGFIVPWKPFSGAERLDNAPNSAASAITFTTMDLGGAHTHTINVPNFSGNTGGSGTLVTDNGPGTASPVATLPPYGVFGLAIRL